MGDEATGLIRITKVPLSEAPLHVKEAWVGLELPCYPIAGYVDDERHVVTGKKKQGRNRIGFLVPQAEALAVLEAHSPEAAQWWKRHGFPRAEEGFCFGYDEAEIVSGVQVQKPIEVRDEDYGNPFR